MSAEGLEVREVQLDEKLYRAVRRLIKERPEFGFLSVDELVRDAIRLSFRSYR